MDVFSYLFRLLLTATLAGSVACLLALLLPRLFPRAFSAVGTYLLRAAALLFLLFPLWVFLPSVSVGGKSGQPTLPSGVSGELPNAPPVSPGMAVTEGGPQAPMPEPATSAQPFDLTPPALLWLSGAALLLLLTGGKQLRWFFLLRRIPLRRPDEETLAQYCLAAAELHLQKRPEAWICAGIASPMLTGVLRPRILLPETEAGPEERRLILTHELCHYRRGDLWIKVLANTALIFHWFNPAVWILTRELNVSCELACDESVTETLSKQGRREYGRAILRVLSEGMDIRETFGLSLCGGKRIMKRRLEQIMIISKQPHFGRAAALIAAVIIGAAGIFAGCMTRPEPPVLSLTGKNEAVSPEAAAREFEESVRFDREKGELRFTTPKALPEGSHLFLHVAGRAGMGGWLSSMSFHLFEEEEDGDLWELGKEYAAPLNAAGLRECEINFALTDQSSGKELQAATIVLYGDGSPEQAAALLRESAAFDEGAKRFRFSLPAPVEDCFILLQGGRIPSARINGGGILPAEPAGETELGWTSAGIFELPLADTGENSIEFTFYTAAGESILSGSLLATPAGDIIPSEPMSGPGKEPAQSVPEAPAPAEILSNPADLTGTTLEESFSSRYFGVLLAFPDDTARPVLAAKEGKVLFAGWKGSLGQLVILDHGNGLETQYAHCSKLTVRAEDTVTAGQELGLSGSTGKAIGNTLGFSVKKDGTAVDPREWLPELPKE